MTREPQCFADRQMDNSVAYCVRTKFVHYMCTVSTWFRQWICDNEIFKNPFRNLDPQTFTVKQLKDNYFRSECKISLLIFNWQLNAEGNDNLSGNLAFGFNFILISQPVLIHIGH